MSNLRRSIIFFSLFMTNISFEMQDLSSMRRIMFVGGDGVMAGKKVETTCPRCGGPIYEDENAATGFCEKCSKEE
jgi:hypothetical protein